MQKASICEAVSPTQSPNHPARPNKSARTSLVPQPQNEEEEEAVCCEVL